MSRLTEVTPFPRRTRGYGTHTPKARPIMKLEWNKLLDEATEKDTKAQKDISDIDNNEYEYEVDESEDDTNRENENINGGGEGEMPLNLCNKSKTMPSLSGQIQKSLALDLSSEKNKQVVVNCTPWQSKKSSSCTVPNFQTFNSNCKAPAAHQVSFGSQNKNFKLNSLGENQNNISSVRRNLDSEINKVHVDEEQKETQKKEHSYVSEKNQNGDIIPLQNSNKIQELEVKKQVSEPSLEIRNKVAETPEKFKAQEKNVQSSSSNDSNRFAVPAVPTRPFDGVKMVINGKSYTILAPLGKGGSSRVYLVFSSDKEVLAVKRVKLSGLDERIKNDYLNEIEHLLKMQHSKHVIKLYDHQYVNSQKLLYVVMERGDTDLSKFLKDKATSDEGISPQLIMYYWTEMLLAVKSIHDNNIIHRDLKPANFLLVSGRLKLIDFGIASAIQTEQTSILTDTQSGTFNYMSPEALKCPTPGAGQKIGRKTDVWSLGCILYYFLYKKTPYQEFMSVHHKIMAITDPQHVVEFPKVKGVPEILIESCRKCLIHDVKKRASIEELLELSREPLLSLSQVLQRLKPALSKEEYDKVAKTLTEEGEIKKA